MSRNFVRANNVQRLRLEFLLTPSELARLMRAEPADIARIENPEFQLADEWVRSVSKALGVDSEAVTGAQIDPAAAKAASSGLARAPEICPVAVRYSISAILAKFGGPDFFSAIPPDNLSRLIQNFFDFVENEREANADSTINRQKLALQITVLAFLQSRDFVPGPGFRDDLETALGGALALMDRFSSIGRAPEGR